MVEVERGVDLLGKPGAGIVGDALVLLFEDDLELGRHRFIGQHQTGHAVGLEFHQRLEMLFRHALEVAGVVLGGEGVFLAADEGHRLRELADRVLGGALEQQMLKEMGEARLAGGLVRGADLVPDHVRDDRCASVRYHHDFETIGEHEMADVGCRRGLHGG